MESLKVPDEMVACTIKANNSAYTTSEAQAMETFCGEIFPNLAANISDSTWLEGRVLVAVTNKEVKTYIDLRVTL